jgi:hypothetical protein
MPSQRTITSSRDVIDDAEDSWEDGLLLGDVQDLARQFGLPDTENFRIVTDIVDYVKTRFQEAHDEIDTLRSEVFGRGAVITYLEDRLEDSNRTIISQEQVVLDLRAQVRFS